MYFYVLKYNYINIKQIYRIQILSSIGQLLKWILESSSIALKKKKNYVVF